MARDFIPAGEELTGEEKARFGLREQEAGIQRPNDYVPDDDHVLVDQTREEKEQFARDAAIASVARLNAVQAGEADRHLKERNGAQAVDFMRNMSPANRQMYLRAEKEGMNREEIFKAYGEPESEEAVGEQEVVPFGAIAANPESEQVKEYERPIETVSPSDRLHRAVRRFQAEGSLDTEALTPNEERSVDDSEENQHYPGDPDNDGIIEDPSAVVGPNAEFDEGEADGGPALAAAKAREAASGRTLTPDDDDVEVEEQDKAVVSPFRTELDEQADAAATGPEDTEGTEGDASEARAPEAGGEKQEDSEEVTKEDIKEAEDVPEVQANRAFLAEQKKAKRAAKKKEA